MNEFQRSAQFWPALAFAARNQKVLSYDMLAKMTGVPRFGQSRPLGNIYFYCEQNGLPPLTSIVIDEKNGRPAASEFDGTDISAAHRRVFMVDWLSLGMPSVQDFEQARAIEDAKATKAAV